MKRILSIALSLAMILSMGAFFVVPTSAEESLEGDWTVWAYEDEYDEVYSYNRRSIPGYYYDEEGFHTYGGEWKGDSPYHLVQTKEAVWLKDGVFMEVRIDEFDYSAHDKWFNINIWRDVNLAPGIIDEKYGEGVQTLLRPSTSNADSTAPGAVRSIQWVTEGFTSCGMSTIEEWDQTTVVDDGMEKNVFKLSVTWSDYDGYRVTINNSQAPDGVIEYMNEAFADGWGYIGISMQSSGINGKQSCTITRFGTSEADATTPVGNDSAEPIIYDNSVADIIDPATVPHGKPAVLMSGDYKNSDLAGVPASAMGELIEITEDMHVRVTARSSIASFGSWTVDNEVSYSVRDFPIIMCVTKNLCTCQQGSYENCYALEAMDAHVMVGDTFAAAPANKYNGLDICYEPYFVKNEKGEIDSYLTFFLDASLFIDRPDFGTGRFNGVRFDIWSVDLETPGLNEFEMCWVGLFRTEDEAFEYALEYIESMSCEDTDDETQSESNSDSEYEGVSEETEEIFTETEDQTSDFEDETIVPDEVTTATEEEDTEDPDREVEEVYEFIEFGDSLIVDISEGYKEYYFELTPEKNGNYYFYSTGDCDTFGAILDEDGKVLAKGDNDNDLNFAMRYNFKKGKTYYLYTGIVDNGEGVYEVHLTRKLEVENDRPDKDDDDGENNETTAEPIFISCSGSIGAGSVVAAVVSLASAGFICLKKRKED